MHGYGCAVWGSQRKVLSKYGSVAIKSKACHEEALRIVLHTVEAAASRHKRAITPLLCVHMDFYVRVFVRVHISPKDTKLSMSKTGMIYQVTVTVNFYSLLLQHDVSPSVLVVSLTIFNRWVV